MKRRLSRASDSATFLWISLLAKRVSAASSAWTTTSACDAPAFEARSSTSSARTSHSAAPFGSFIEPACRSPFADAHLDVAEARPGDRVADVAGLAGLALAAVWSAQHHVAALVADGIARTPELVGDPGIGGVLEQAALPATLDLVGDLGRELEVQAPIVDRPAPVRAQVQPVVGVGHDLVEAHAGPGQQVDVGHPDERDPVPAIGAHRASGLAADPRGRFAAAQVAHEDALLDQGHRLGGHPFVIPTERAQAGPDR